MKLLANKKIFIASDHAGFELKKSLINLLQQKNPEYIVHDFGADSSESAVDYPKFAFSICDAMDNVDDAVGILICGSGIGMSIAANRKSYIRAALCYSEEIAYLARRHNNANVLVLGGRLISQEEAVRILNTFLSTAFEGGRHAERISCLAKY